MSLAVARLDPAPSFLAIDGNGFPAPRGFLPLYSSRASSGGGDGKSPTCRSFVLIKTHPQYEYAAHRRRVPRSTAGRKTRLPARTPWRSGSTVPPHHRLTFNHEIDSWTSRSEAFRWLRRTCRRPKTRLTLSPFRGTRDAPSVLYPEAAAFRCERTDGHRAEPFYLRALLPANESGLESLLFSTPD